MTERGLHEPTRDYAFHYGFHFCNESNISLYNCEIVKGRENGYKKNSLLDDQAPRVPPGVCFVRIPLDLKASVIFER